MSFCRLSRLTEVRRSADRSAGRHDRRHEGATRHAEDHPLLVVRHRSRGGSRLLCLPCGWLKDRYGVSWQVVPTALNGLLSDPDTARAQRAMKAMLAMNKIDIEALRRAGHEEGGEATPGGR